MKKGHAQALTARDSYAFLEYPDTDFLLT